jgi:hypothetical protein
MMSMTEFREQDLTGARVRGASFNDSRMRGVEHRLYAERDLTALKKET